MHFDNVIEELETSLMNVKEKIYCSLICLLAEIPMKRSHIGDLLDFCLYVTLVR